MPIKINKELKESNDLFEVIEKVEEQMQSKINVAKKLIQKIKNDSNYVNNATTEEKNIIIELGKKINKWEK